MTHLHRELQEFGDNVARIFSSDARLTPEANQLISSAPGRELERAKKIFSMRARLDCPAEFEEGLFLPEQLNLTWQSDGHVGEANLSYLSGSVKRRVDESQFELEFFGTKLSDYRILDEVHALAGPFFVLYRIVDNRIDPQLFYFDTREVWKLDISYPDYIRTVFGTFAPVFWHSLFIDEPLVKTRAEKLEGALDFLMTKISNPYLLEMRARLAAKS